MIFSKILVSVIRHFSPLHYIMAFKTRNSSGDEIANVNFLYDDIVHALKMQENYRFNSATDRFLQCRFTKFSEITQYAMNAMK